jgi:hypothetical protein
MFIWDHCLLGSHKSIKTRLIIVDNKLDFRARSAQIPCKPHKARAGQAGARPTAAIQPRSNCH